jgi:hypothetical protein
MDVIKGALDFYESVSLAIPENYRLILVLVFFTAVIVIYSLFIFYFYKFMARKNIFSLNLDQYAETNAQQFFRTLFYILEFLIILPIAILFWFAILSIFLLMLSKTAETTMILTISAALVAATRVASYVNEDLSKDLAKLLPFILLGLFLVEPDFFSITLFVERMAQIPSLFIHIPYYLIFIAGVELLFRVLDFFGIIYSNSGEERAQ